MFSLSQLTALAGASLDANRTGETSYRYDGLTLKVRVGYSEPQHYDYYLAINELKTKEVGMWARARVRAKDRVRLLPRHQRAQDQGGWDVG